MSKASVRSKVLQEIREEDRPEWDQSVRSKQRKMDIEDKIATRLASEVLKDNNKLRGVHSN